MSFRTMLPRFFPFGALIVAAIGPAHGDRAVAQDARVNRPGDEVVVVVESDLKIEERAVGTVRRGMIVKVGRSGGKWLWIEQPRAGWIHRRNVVPRPEGMAYFDAEIKKNPDDATLRAARGHLRKHAGDFDGAIADYTAAIERDKSDPFTFANRGYCWYLKEDYAQAVADFDEAIRLDPSDAAALNNRGHNHQLLGDYALAVADYRAAIELDDKFAAAHNNLAWLLATCPDDQVRDGSKAFQHASRAVTLTQRKNADFIDTLAAAYAEAGDFTKAVQAAEFAIAVAPPDEVADLRRQIELYRQKKPVRDEP